MSPNVWDGDTVSFVTPIFCDKNNIVVKIHGCITVGNPRHKIMEYRSKMNIISGLSVDQVYRFTM